MEINQEKKHMSNGDKWKETHIKKVHLWGDIYIKGIYTGKRDITL